MDVLGSANLAQWHLISHVSCFTKFNCMSLKPFKDSVVFEIGLSDEVYFTLKQPSP